jgi:hypothetical protein
MSFMQSGILLSMKKVIDPFTLKVVVIKSDV